MPVKRVTCATLLPRQSHGVLIEPSVKFADRNQSPPTRVDDSQLRINLLVEVAAADADSLGGLLDGQGELRRSASVHGAAPRSGGARLPMSASTAHRAGGAPAPLPPRRLSAILGIWT